MHVVIGRVGRAHGLRGEVAVEIRTDEPERRFAVGTVVACSAEHCPTLTVRQARPHGSRWLATFSEISERSQAERLRGSTLSVETRPEERPGHPEEYYDHQLVGLRARTTDGVPVGAVAGLVHLPSQDLLAVRRSDGVEVLVPFVADLVPDVDPAAGTVTIAERPGLLDPESVESDAPTVPGGGPGPRT